MRTTAPTLPAGTAAGDTTTGSDLVIVYHRQPYEEVEVDGRVEYRENTSPNGIVPTLKSFFGQVDQGAWVAWKQVAEEVPPGADAPFDRVVSITDSFGTYDVSRLPLTPAQVSSFYHVTSKEALWPILHSFPTNYDYDPVDWPTFTDVNRRFAEAAAAQAKDDALIWVHDYNLWLAPLFIRELKPDARIAFFHHTPFPSADLFNVLPWRAEIVRSLLACDLVGFHIPRYADNFVSVARSLFGVEVEASVDVLEGMSPVGMALSEPTMPTRIRHEGRSVEIDAWPVGTNVEYVEQIAAREDTVEAVRAIREELGDRKLIVSVGRTDYTKGTRETLEAYGRLLERRPELVTKVTLMVISVAANRNMAAYQQAQEEIEALVGRINGAHASFGWQPVILFSTASPFEELISYYRAADVCLIAPLRDGLNLVAKEFVASRLDDTGVLVLSEFAGTSLELPDAVLCNPNSHRSMDTALDDALAMTAAEQARRMRALREGVRRFDIAHWARHTLERFEELGGGAAEVAEAEADLEPPRPRVS